MSTSSQKFTAPSASTTAGLQYANINVDETDIGAVIPFTSTNASLSGFSHSLTGAAYHGVTWSAFDMAIAGANASEALKFTFDVNDTNTAMGISGLDALYIVDLMVGSGDHVQAVETAYDDSGNLLGTQTYTYGAAPHAPVPFSSVQQSVHVTVTLTESIDATGNAASAIDLSQISAGLSEAPLATASIGDIVFLDSTNSGLESGFDSGPGVPGVTVQLLNSTGTTVLASTVTNASGRYSFTGLAAGTYEVKFVPLANYTFSTQGVGSNSAINSSANKTTGITGPITLTAGQQDHNVEAGLVPGGTGAGGTASIGDFVWFDADGNGIQDSSEKGVSGVTVDLLNTSGTVIGVTTTNSSGHYSFANLAAGTYQVKFIAPAGDSFTKQAAGSNSAADSNPNASTGLTAPITLTAGQTDNSIDAGLIPNGIVSILKTPCSMTVNACGQITYTMKVINGGTSPLTAVNVQDNIGSAATPDWVQATAVTSTGGYNVGDSNKNGVLDPGESWTYSETINQINATAIASGSVTHTPTGSYLTSGNTAWLSTTFNAPSSQNGATYVFQGIKCTFTGTGVGATPLVEKCPDAVITFSSSCTSPATHYDNVRNAWVTTLPAGGNPGSIFMSGLPVPIPAGVDLSKASATFTIDDAGDNVGASTITWDGTCKGFANFNQNGCNGSTDFNQIGVKVCDDSSHYGSGGNCNTGYGWNGSCYSSNSYYNSYNYNYGCGSNYNNWIGSGSDCAGTPENQYTQYNCNTGSYSSSCGGYSSNYGWSGGYNCYSSSSYGCCGSGGCSGGSYNCYSSSSYSCGNDGCSNSGYGCGNDGHSNSGYGCGNDGYYSGNGCYDYQYSYNCNSNYYSGCNYSYGGSCGGGGSATNNLPTTGITGAADSVTVTATTATGTTVTATDTKEVMVLAGSNVQVCGTATTAGLTTTYGTAQTLEFTYNPSNTVALKQVQAGLGTATGSNSNSMAFIEISNNANPFASNATIYFEGNVATGQKIYADATLNPLTNTAVAAASAHFDTTAGANIFAYVFNSAADLTSGAAPVQTITYNTSGSQVMHIGDQIGSLTLAGFVGSKGGYLVS